MESSVKITSIIAGTLILLVLVGVYTAFQLSPTAQTNVITANGMAEVTAVPNEVGLYFNIEGKGADAKTAKDKNTEITDALISALVKEGFDRDEIQTLNYNIYEDFDWSYGTRKSLGYKATQTVVVRMSTSNTDKIGKAIDAGVDANATLSYINFELSQELENQYRAQAIKLAAEDAKMQATALAEGSGNTLGKLVSISNQNFYYQPWRAYDYAVGATAQENLAMAKSATSIQPSEQKISAQVSVVYKIR